MSDESPPPKPKPGSLRDRIAAFEQKPPANAPPPAPRPKPGHVQWKPRSASPPPPPVNAGDEGATHASGAADIKESIGASGMSLKERMAALQGRGAFAAPPPAPAPRSVSDRPKWKPPVAPAPIPPTDTEGESVDQEGDSTSARVKSPVRSPSENESGEVPSEVTDIEKSAAPSNEGEPATAEGGDDPDEEERKRRAAIAARMARLGGARIGMGPPVFAPVSRSNTTSQPPPKDEHAPAESVDKTTDSSDTAMKIDIPSAPSETSLLSADSGSSARSPPTHMPVPSGPKRAGPPRRRPPKSPGAPSSELPPTPSDAEKDKEEDATPSSAAERDEKKLEEVTPAEEEVPDEETEEEAAARRKRIADRIAKSGGINPFSASRLPQEEEEGEAKAKQEEVEVKSEPEPEPEHATEILAEADSEAEVPPESPDEPEEENEEGSPPPLPAKITSPDVDEANKNIESPVAFPAKEEEPSVPVVDLSKPAEVSPTMEDVEKHSVDITEAAAEYKDTGLNTEEEEKESKIQIHTKKEDEDEDEEKDGPKTVQVCLVVGKVSPTHDDDDGHESSVDKALTPNTRALHAVSGSLRGPDSAPALDYHNDDHDCNNDERKFMRPPRITRPLPPTPPDSDSDADDVEHIFVDAEDGEAERVKETSSPPNGFASAVNDNNDDKLNEQKAQRASSASPPLPPPPPPPPPLPTPWTGQKLRVVRRQTDPSSLPSPSSPSSTSNSTPSPPTPQSTLKRNNTINSLSPVSPQRPSNFNGNANGRRPSSPPPALKPKPAAFTLGSKRRKGHERSPSASSSLGSAALLKTAIVQGAAAATGAKPTIVQTATAVDTEEPERRNSVSQIARSLESTLHLGPPPSPGSPPAKRGSMQSLKKNKRKAKDSEEASSPEAASAEVKKTTPNTPVNAPASRPADLQATIASLAAAKALSTAPAVAASFALPSPPTPAPSSPVVSAPPTATATKIPPPPPTPPLSPPTVAKTQENSVSLPSSPSVVDVSSSASTPLPPPPPPPPPVVKPESQDEEKGAVDSPTPAVPSQTDTPTVDEEPTALPKRVSVPPPPRPPPAPPMETDADADEGAKVDGEGSASKPPQRVVPDLPPPTPVKEEEREDAEEVAEEDAEEGKDTTDVETECGEAGILGGIVVQEPEEMGEIEDEQGHESDSDDDRTYSSSDDGHHESFKSALSQNASSNPPTPPIKHFSSSFQLTSKWSRNTSAIASANASASTLAQSQTQSQEDSTLIHDIDSRFPPEDSFPPPPPLPFKKRTQTQETRALPLMNGPDESSMSLASLPEGRSSDEDGESHGPRLRSETKETLTSAIAAALARSTPELANSPPLSHIETDSASRSSDEETDPVTRKLRERLAKLDALELPRPAPFPSAGDGSKSQSTPEVPQVRRAGDERTRQVRLSSKLLPITGAVRMNTSPVSAWGKNKMVMSSDTVGTIGTIATEPGDLDTSQFGLSFAGRSSFLNRSKTEKRPPARRQTTSQSSRFVEDLPVSLPFLKRSVDPAYHQRSATVSFSARSRKDSSGPPTRKMSLVPELRAATVEAAERPVSAVSGDFVLVEEPEEFDIPRAEWDLPRIPSGSLGFPSTVDLSRPNWSERTGSRTGSPAPDRNGNGMIMGGPASAPATTAPSVPMAPVMLHSRSASGTTTTGNSGTTGTSTSAPSGPLSSQPSSGSEAGARLSSDSLLDLWGRVGVYISDAAALLHDKSRRVLVGDGTYPGFVLAVSRQVPMACIPSKTARYPYGHLIYFQTAGTVHKRYAEIMPGDVIVLQNALFKGARGPFNQSYQEELGAKGDPVVGVIGEFEARKSKVRVYQANQHVGVQTVEYVSYKFEDLKSGTIKIFRVPDS